MKKFKNVITIAMVVVLITSTLTGYNRKIVSAISKSTVTEGKPVKVGVLLYKLDDFISEVRKSLEDI